MSLHGTLTLTLTVPHHPTAPPFLYPLPADQTHSHCSTQGNELGLEAKLLIDTGILNFRSYHTLLDKGSLECNSIRGHIAVSQ